MSQQHAASERLLPSGEITAVAEITEVLKRDAGFPNRSVVKNPPAMQEMQVQSLGREDPLEKGMAAHSNILA